MHTTTSRFTSVLAALTAAVLLLVPAISGAQISYVPITDFELTETVWEFGRGDGSVIAKIKLKPGGRIEGYSHPNEAKWGIEGKELVFYTDSGAASTKFDSFDKKGGKWVISGRFLLWGNITHVLKEVSGSTGPAAQTPPPAQTPVYPQYQPSSSALPISDAELTGSEWEFGRSDGSHIGRLRLVPGGSITGYSHPNESRWGIEGRDLVFYHSGGSASTRFQSFDRSSGRWVISGPFLFGGSFNHVLKQVGGYSAPGASYGSNAVLTVARSPYDYVGSSEALRPNNSTDNHIRLTIKGTGKLLSGIEMRNVNGQYSVWDTVPGNGYWTMAVAQNGYIMNDARGAFRPITVNYGQDAVLDLYVQDNGSISGRGTDFKITLFYGDGSQEVVSVARY